MPLECHAARMVHTHEYARASSVIYFLCTITLCCAITNFVKNWVRALCKGSNFFECTTNRTKDALCLHISDLWAQATAVVLCLSCPTDEF